MIESGYNQTELGKIIAATFITDLGTVLALGFVCQP
jgi:hypothetical protein